MLTGWQSRGWGASRFGGEEGGENRQPQLSEPTLVGELSRMSDGQSPTSSGGAPTWHSSSGNSGSSPPGTRGIPGLTSTPARVFGLLSRAVPGLRADGRHPAQGNRERPSGQAGIKIAGRNINNLRYADDTTLMAEREELKRLLMKAKEGEKLA